MTALDQFSEATRTWFGAAFGSPTSAQEGAWRSVAATAAPWSSRPPDRERRSQRSCGASTGSCEPPRHLRTRPGTAHHGPPRRRAHLPPGHPSPLHFAAEGAGRRHRAEPALPLVGIRHTAERLGSPSRTISVGVRTGDTTSKQRRDLLRQPPEILITTPESLYLMLTSRARETLTGVDTVIIDEVHALVGTKRGAHLAVSLERLDELRRQQEEGPNSPAQRIGLSATVEPKDEVARFLGGSQAVDIVAPPHGQAVGHHRLSARAGYVRPGGRLRGRRGRRAAHAAVHLAPRGAPRGGPHRSEPVHHRVRELSTPGREAHRPPQRDLARKGGAQRRRVRGELRGRPGARGSRQGPPRLRLEGPAGHHRR